MVFPRDFFLSCRIDTFTVTRIKVIQTTGTRRGRLDESFIHVYCYVSKFTVETYCFADGRCLFKQPQSVLYHWNQYDEEISKKCRSVRLSVCNANKKKAHSSFIIDSRKIIRISDERVWHPLQGKEAIFSEK